jgi:hypothetical protein
MVSNRIKLRCLGIALRNSNCLTLFGEARSSQTC